MREVSDLQQLPIELDRDGFMRSLLGELAGMLQDVVGLDEASGLISMVGQTMGERILDQYRDVLNDSGLSREQVAAILVDLKRRIQGDFYVISQDAEKIVFGNRACPFADKVLGRPALCMMTSNVFGVITAETQGYAKVSIERAIATGDEGCRVVVYLKNSDEADDAEGREYYRAN